MNISEENYDIGIVGAGAAGLMAARTLSEKGLHCAVFEAAYRMGGRVFTVTGEGFDYPAEGGAEFIHGKLKTTLSLLREANLRHEEVQGGFIGFREGRWRLQEEHDPHWDEFMKELKKLEEDCTMSEFLRHHFGGEEYKGLHEAVRRFAEGFNLADPEQASMISVRAEWKEIDKPQYRVVGGYGLLMDFLFSSCKKQGVDFFFAEPVVSVSVDNGQCLAETTKRKFTCRKVIITSSVGALLEDGPAIKPISKTHTDALKQLGFGSVIKILFQFRKAFWKKRSANIGFILTDEDMPTWWTRHPENSCMLAGWLGGPSSELIARLRDNEILAFAINTLQKLFPGENIEEQIQYARVFNWPSQPFIRGGYSYHTLYSETALKVLATPIEDLIYFAGEAYNRGESQGTVDAALESGKTVAEKILSLLPKK